MVLRYSVFSWFARRGRPLLPLLSLLLLSGSALAQGQLPRYRLGKTQLDAGNYAAALRELVPLAQPINHFAQAADAGYLAAVAASRLGQWAEAEQLLNLIRNQHPTYAGLPDVLYLQGQVSFEQGDYDTALRTLGQLPAGQLTAERAAMQAAYLAKLKNRATWQRLLKRYPQSALVGRLYADFVLGSGAASEADRQQLDGLITRFQLDRARYAAVLGAANGASAYKVAPRRSGYVIGVLLPFELQDNSWEKKRKNQFITDLYAGLRLAQDSLARAGRVVQLLAYDTGPDTLMLKAVLALPELAGVDLLVGPVYKSGAKLLARYAREHQIICVNPMSQDLDLVRDNAYHYLFTPSAATQGRRAAEFAAASLGTSRPALLTYEDNRDGTDFTQAFRAAYEAAGGRVLTRRPFRPGSLTTGLTTSPATSPTMNSTPSPITLAAALPAADLAAAGVVVVASDNRLAGPAAFAALAKVPAGRRPALLAPGTWLDNPYLDLNQLSAPGTYFYYPKYYDPLRPGYQRFRQLYLNRQHLPPSVFASQGFELGLFFGNALHQFGPNFQAGLAAAPPQPGAIFGGLAYPGAAHDNQLVPLVKLSNLEIQPVR